MYVAAAGALKAALIWLWQLQIQLLCQGAATGLACCREQIMTVQRHNYHKTHSSDGHYGSGTTTMRLCMSQMSTQCLKVMSCHAIV